MRIVIDTNVLCKAALEFSPDHIAIMVFMNKLGYYLVLDHKQQLLKEYLTKVRNSQLFQKWYQEMLKRNQVHWANGQITRRIAEELKKRDLHEPEDHIVVALAINTDKYIITEDSDFGKGDPRRAAQNQIALTYLTNDLNLVVHDVVEASDNLTRS